MELRALREIAGGARRGPRAVDREWSRSASREARRYGSAIADRTRVWVHATWSERPLDVPHMSAPRIEVQTSPELLTLQASLELDRLSSLPRDAAWRLGLSALIEETSGRKSYWALAHPPGKADFHHSDCFAHEFSRA